MIQSVVGLSTDDDSVVGLHVVGCVVDENVYWTGAIVREVI